MDIGEHIDFNELSELQQKDIIEKGYSIICDRTNNSQEDIDNNRVNVTVIWSAETC